VSTYRVQVRRVCGTVELDVLDCSSTEEAVKRVMDGLLAHPEQAFYMKGGIEEVG
jgi:hypothetical protein